MFSFNQPTPLPQAKCKTPEKQIVFDLNCINVYINVQSHVNV